MQRKLGRKSTPTAAVIDSERASTTQASSPHGFDPGKRGTPTPVVRADDVPIDRDDVETLSHQNFENEA